MSRLHPSIFAFIVLFGASAAWGVPESSQGGERGYYRFPALRGETLVFTAEGDLWKVGLEGGEARRLTTHPGQETHAAISPDGLWVAFSGAYEGPTEVYVMPTGGGLPQRLTWEGGTARVVGWTPQGEVLYSTRHFSTLPQTQLAAVHPETRAHRLLPLAQASDGTFVGGEGLLVFTRFPFQGSYTKRYQGGTAQNLWRFHQDEGEARPLTSDFPGTSRDPMAWGDRILFVSERDGNLDLWSMDLEGGDLRQHSQHHEWDVKSPTLDGDRVVYQLGADLRFLDLASGEDVEIPIALPSDFEQRRERWLHDPTEYLTAAHLSPDGERVVLTARGQVFVAPVESGRLVEASRADGVRYRSARFLDEEDLLVLSDESGEVELWKLDARGLQPRKAVTDDGTVLRFDTLPSPDGRHAAFWDHDEHLWVVNLEEGKPRKVATSPYFGFRGLAWSPDSRWLAFAVPAENFLHQIWIYGVGDGESRAVTSDRFESFDPAWSPDGRWLYFLSDRNLVSVVRSPWGVHQPGPFLDRKTHIYLLALQPGQRSPFVAADETQTSAEKKDDEGQKKPPRPPEVKIQWEGLAGRLYQVPVAPGNYERLSVAEKALFFLDAKATVERPRSLKAVQIDEIKAGKSADVETVVSDGVGFFELSADGKKLLVRKGNRLTVFPARAKAPSKLSSHRVPLGRWAFRFDPREEWRQMFVDAWRLLRDYFYDPGMHGVPWEEMREKYLPLVDRVTDRAELSDLFGELTGELSTLHHYVRGGDLRRVEESVFPASLGAVLERDEAAGGYRVQLIYRGDPELPEEWSPLARPGVDVGEGDVIVSIDGTPTLSVPHPGQLLRGKMGKQVLLHVQDATGEKARQVIVMPLSPDAAQDLRYHAWETERRVQVEDLGDGKIGYVHLRAMTGRNYTEWARNFLRVFNRHGLIVDVRQNRGGNIDSWILGSLLRKPWMWWKPRRGILYSNMQQSFRGHMVVLCDEFTRSDGEAFAEGFRRLGLGDVIGTRTWGGEIWLTSSNGLVDGGIATAAEFGVYGPEGTWLIEGHGVEPDHVVDNLPHATFQGQDAQLEAAVKHLLDLLAEDPREVPEAPPYPDKSLPPAQP